MSSQPVLYYVVRTGSKHEIVDMTAAAMAALTETDNTLADRMDRTPFTTRREAEIRKTELDNSN